MHYKTYINIIIVHFNKIHKANTNIITHKH